MPTCQRTPRRVQLCLGPHASASAPRGVRICSQRRLNQPPDAVASAPAFVNKHREQIGGDDSAVPICRHPKYGATLELENKNPVNPQPFIQLRIYWICVLRISLRCALRLISQALDTPDYLTITLRMLPSSIRRILMPRCGAAICRPSIV